MLNSPKVIPPAFEVFFWHVLARSDVPKHLAEALADPAQPARATQDGSCKT